MRKCQVCNGPIRKSVPKRHCEVVSCLRVLVPLSALCYFVVLISALTVDLASSTSLRLRLMVAAAARRA